MFTFLSKSLLETKKIAIALASLSNNTDVFCLEGDMGAGKTAFCKEFISFLSGYSLNEITSPTFPIICTYNSPLGEIHHLDLYRINSQEELFELGIEEILHNHLCLIEWSEKLESYYPKNPIKIKISHINTDTREIKITIPESQIARFQPLQSKI